MAVPYRKIARRDPQKVDATKKFYLQLVALGQGASLESIVYEMKEKSSLSLGDIKGVLTSFVEMVRTSLYNGQSVSIQDFEVFSLSARIKGVDAEKDRTARNVVTAKINFCPSSSVRPNLASTRAGNRVEFIDIKAAPEGKETGRSGDGDIMGDPTA